MEPITIEFKIKNTDKTDESILNTLYLLMNDLRYEIENPSIEYHIKRRNYILSNIHTCLQLLYIDENE